MSDRTSNELAARDLPIVRVETFRDALRLESLRSTACRELERWLRARRWFGAKGSDIRSIVVSDVVPLFPDDPPSAVARVEVELSGNGRGTYQVPLAVRAVSATSAAAPIARIETKDGDALLFDAVEDARFREQLGQTFASCATFAGSNSRWAVEPIGDAGRQAIPRGVPGAVGRAEQSNTSIRYGDRAILKLIRRLESGENPDAEIGAFLATRTSFRNVPRLYGVIRHHDADGATAVAGVLHAFIAGSVDGWGYALARLRETIDSDDPSLVSFAPDARRLGEIVRGLHAALASDADHPDFAPIPTTVDDVRRWGERVHEQASRTGDLLGGGKAVANRREAIGDRVFERIDTLVERIGDDGGRRIRHHGDLHLGQVLRTENGDFLIIDFEGEPARPLTERRQRQSALRDVAGMLRSFDYAAGSEILGRSGNARAAERARAWRKEIRAAFLDGYRSAAPGAFLPSKERSFESLLALFELEKVLYEIAYELNSRPDWVDIPLRDLEGLLGDAG